MPAHAAGSDTENACFPPSARPSRTIAVRIHPRCAAPVAAERGPCKKRAAEPAEIPNWGVTAAGRHFTRARIGDGQLGVLPEGLRSSGLGWAL